MSRTRIKICGITRPQDADIAVDAGADAIGMVFHPDSPRNIRLAYAVQIVETLPPFVTGVGLFVNATVVEIRAVVGEAPLGMIQLHGNESPDFVRSLAPHRILKAIRVDPATFEADLDRWRRSIAAGQLEHLTGIVLETARTSEPGGTGQPNNWDFIERIQRRNGFDGLPPILAAGGLSPANVASVVRQLHPWAVDVSSGVEGATRGIKDPAAILEFVRAVRQTDSP